MCFCTPNNRTACCQNCPDDKKIQWGLLKKTKNQFNIDEMNLIELKDIIKMLVRLMNHEHDRLTALQDRVLELELKKLKKKE